MPPVPVLAAAVLAAENVSFLLVGSAALWLQGEAAGWLYGKAVTVADTDVVINPAEQNLVRLSEALASMALRPREIPRERDFALLHLVSVTTCYGRIDCLLERGRLDWARLCRSSVTVPVADVCVQVAALADVQALRRRFKE